jgi:hypothetical protein
MKVRRAQRALLAVFVLALGATAAPAGNDGGRGIDANQGARTMDEAPVTFT